MKLKSIVIWVVVVLLAILIVQNMGLFPLRFLFWPVIAPGFLIVFIIFAFGFFIGFLAARLDRRRDRKTPAPPPSHPEKP